MITHGGLAAEVGFKRLSQVREQILSLCEAAHVPVIQVTQVLEGLARTGAPIRAAFGDAVK